ncbi:MAG TPA: divergent PAP2 family protein [Sediminispirochaeta sp.]|nr:divergent PAP2 family protein [Sediminispirochaeta sp.]
MNQLAENTILWTTLLSALVAQVLKTLQEMLFHKKLSLKRIFETGGMPSSHSAAVASLATSMGLVFGFDSPYFTISAVLAIIVIYDATGIRRAAGEHAEILNDLLKEFHYLIRQGIEPQHLKTLLGHTYPQALVGILIGISISLIVFL